MIDTDFEILFPNKYISQVNERLKLYTKLSKVKDPTELNEFESQLKDKYGKLPAQVRDLLKSINLKWKAQKLGFEKIVIKRNKMLCYFISDVSNSYYESKTFKNIIQEISKLENCEIKEKNKLYVIFSEVKSIEEAISNLDRFKSIDN